MKNLIICEVLFIVLMIVGCSETAKVETPPWSDQQVEQMRDEEIETVPLAIFRF